MTSNNFLKSKDKNAQKRIVEVHDIDAFNNLVAQVEIFNNNFKKLNVAVVTNLVYKNYAGNHPSLECQFGGLYEVNSSEQVNYMSNNQRQYNPNSKSFNQGWRNHPNFSRSNNTHVQKPPSGFQSQENKPNLEEFSPNLCKRLTILLMILKQILGTKVQVFATLSIKWGRFLSY